MAEEVRLEIRKKSKKAGDDGDNSPRKSKKSKDAKGTIYEDDAKDASLSKKHSSHKSKDKSKDRPKDNHKDKSKDKAKDKSKDKLHDRPKEKTKRNHTHGGDEVETDGSLKKKRRLSDAKKSEKHGRRSKGEAANGLQAAPPPEFPFYTQTISLYVPLYPVGFDKPVSAAAHQHLEGLLNQYSPLLGGYLLAYRNVHMSEFPEYGPRRGPASGGSEADEESGALLAAVDEYAVGFGRLTADVDLFVPSRGACLEGTVILQNEGSIGVNCWEKFNASIEASRLPRTWKYVNVDPSSASSASSTAALSVDGEDADAGAGVEAAAADDEQGGRGDGDADTGGVPSQMHATGYWVDEDDKPVQGTIRFYVKNFDVGLAGDSGYLAIEGTMLSDFEERALLLREKEKSRKSGSAQSRLLRRLPEFSITQFGRESDEASGGELVVPA